MTLICNNCRNAYCREPVDGRFEPCSVLASPKRCLFCGKAGVHGCTGGEVPGGYWSRRARLNGDRSDFDFGGTSQQYFSGSIDADYLYALPEIDP